MKDANSNEILLKDKNLIPGAAALPEDRMILALEDDGAMTTYLQASLEYDSKTLSSPKHS